MTNDDLKYAYQDASGWHIQTVDSEGEVGEGTSLALDGNGYPHISYDDETNSDLKYAYRDASGWHSEKVDDASTPILRSRWIRLVSPASATTMPMRRSSSMPTAPPSTGSGESCPELVLAVAPLRSRWMRTVMRT